MGEVHTCICGAQTFRIHDGTITCIHCDRIYDLQVIWVKEELERSDAFNERIKKEE